MVAQWVRAFAPQVEDWGLNLSHDKPKLLKKVVTAPLPNAPKQVCFTAVTHWVRAFAQQEKSRVFESQPRQTQVVKTGGDNPTAKRTALNVNVPSSQR